ncbi:autotransporter assembly complex family protein [Rhizobium sp. CSW-27]|uniref:autotransporter assembly complex protein TamA n=1 Tax=Rhizobium sp. CSW-27 TaxID=2839985 RepID=UPI001C030D48|nr:autotransporter assembly complex family protein [Rhizobium sp. CSW-27]MBT9370748.1 autotransporter assembly complex protein TamA [Rhizobium sp. CSW-27]
MQGPPGARALRRAAVAAFLAAGLLSWPGFVAQAHAFKLFGITLFGSEEEETEVIDPVSYSATLSAPGAGKELAERLENTATLVQDAEEPVSGDLGLVVKAREDRERLVAVLYEEARYGGVVRIALAGTDLDELPPIPRFDHSRPVSVTITVEPGPVFTLGSVRLEGDAARLDPATYGLVPGGAAGSVRIIQAGERIVRDLKAEGRPLSRLTTRDVVADHATRTVSVTLAAESGPVASLGTVSVKGARAVSSDFIRRYSRLDDGQPYSPEQLKKAAERLRALSALSSVTVREADHLAPDGSLPLTIEVSEGKFRYFGAGAEYSSIDGAGLSGYWGHRNLFGEAETLRIEGKVSGLGATTDYTSFDYTAGIYFTKPGALLPRITWDASLVAKRETPDTYTANSLTALSKLSYELNDRDTVSGGAEIAFSESEDAFGTNTYLTFALPFTFERDARDNKLDPIEGFRLTAAVTPSYEALGGTVFSSFEGSASGYVGLGADDRLVLAAHLAAGSVVGGDGLEDIPTTRRFFAGGGGSVRGYAYQEISPYNNQNEATGGRSYTVGSLEARFKVNEKIGIVPFFDVGTVSTEIVPDFSDIRMGAGLGLRYATPFGPLRLDVALPLNRFDGGSRYGIYAGIGQSF